MVPRFVLPESIVSLSKLTFAGRALDGFFKVFWLKVFWYDDPGAGVIATLVSIPPEIAVLGSAKLIFTTPARVLARHLEAV